MRIRVKQLGRGGFGYKGRWGTIAGGAAAGTLKSRAHRCNFFVITIFTPIGCEKNMMAVFSVVSLGMISLMMCTQKDSIDILADNC